MLQDAQIEQLTDLIYDAAVEPQAWTAVMGGLKRLFHTEAETLYFLDYSRRSKQYVHIEGVDAGFMRDFPEMFYRDDNPCIHAPALHRPGVVRTDELLCRHLGDQGALARSAYFNEWMRPQDLRHSMGCTPLAEGGRVLNFSLLRPAKAGPFDAEEQRCFRLLGVHLRRALRIALRLETLTAGRGLAAEALDALRHGVLMLGEDGRLLHANLAAERLLGGAAGLWLRGGRLVAGDAATQRRLDAMLRRLTRPGVDRAAEPATVQVQGAARRLVVSGARLSARRGRFLGGRPAVLLVVVDPGLSRPTSAALMRRGYGFNATEIRLAQALLAGHSLREAAGQVGLTYQTARWYLKALFQKTGTSRQGEFVALLLGELGAAALATAGAG